jgi:hypothetical protein
VIDAIPAENATRTASSRSSTSRAGKAEGRDEEPENFQAVDDLRLLMGFNVEAVVADPDAIDALIEKHYAKSSRWPMS